jgi:hypothetical protein
MGGWEDGSRCYGEYIRNLIVGCGIEKSGMAWHGTASFQA